jgi:hypothetical protein
MLALGAFGTLAACSSDKLTAEVHAPAATTLGAAGVEPAAAIIAVGDTIQLTVQGATLTGVPVPANELDSVRYALVTAGDSVRARVDRVTGAVVGVAPSAGPNHVRVNVFLFKGRVAAGAQALVQVTQGQIDGPLALSIQPASPAAAQLTTGVARTTTPAIWDAATHDSVDQPLVRYMVKSADTLRVGIYLPNVIIPDDINPDRLTLLPRQSPTVRPDQILPYVGEGSAWVYAEVTAYGQPLRDSTLYTFVHPSSMTITTTKTNLAVTAVGYQDQVLTLAPGAIVTFKNGVGDAMRVAYTFDQPDEATAVGSGTAGNIAPLSAGQTARRQFLHAGTYRWTATASNAGAPWDGQTVTGVIRIE